MSLSKKKAKPAPKRPETSPNPKSSTPLYIEGLTPLRGLAAIYVVLFHYMDDFGFGINIFYKGYLAVDFFFILSGFIIAHIYTARFLEKPSLKVYKDYLLLRLARIYPIHLFSLLLVLALFLLGFDGGLKREGTDRTLSSFFANLLLIHNWNLYDTLQWNFPAWSLSAEWFCYLLFPFTAPLLSRIYSPVKLLALHLLTLLVLQILILHNYKSFNIDINYEFGVIRAYCGFIQGMIIYRFFSANLAKKLGEDGAFFFCLAAILGLLFISPLAEPFIFIPLGIMVLSAAYNNGMIKKILNWAPLLFLGEISLSIYLLQFPIWIIYEWFNVYLLHTNPESFLFFTAGVNMLFYFTLLFGVSHLSFRYIEKPMRQHIREKYVRA